MGVPARPALSPLSRQSPNNSSSPSATPAVSSPRRIGLSPSPLQEPGTASTRWIHDTTRPLLLATRPPRPLPPPPLRPVPPATAPSPKTNRPSSTSSTPTPVVPQQGLLKTATSPPTRTHTTRRGRVLGGFSTLDTAAKTRATLRGSAAVLRVPRHQRSGRATGPSC